MSNDPFAAIGARLAAPEPDDADWQMLELRERSRLDPLTGCPMQVGDHLVEPGEWEAIGLADRRTGLPVNCPVVPLGRIDGASVMLNAMGDIATLKDSSSGKGPIGGVFAGRSKFLEWAWPRRGKGTKANPKGPVVGWEADNARQALVDACAFEGAYDPDQMHGRGAWRDDAGQLAYHAGNRVWINGKWEQPGRHDGWIYPTRPTLAPPWPIRVPDMHGPIEQLRPVFETWNWRRKDIDVHLLLGWVCMAMLGGALDWRAMVFVTGEKGCGKSTLLNLLKTLFGGGLLKSGNTSGAYLYQKLGHDCIPCVIDELEAQAGSNLSKVMAIIELIRTASSGDKVGRGSSEGIAREFECRSAFICTSINVPPMRQQDQSRFAILNLNPFASADAEPKIPWEDMRDVGRKLLRRMIDGWPRWKRTLLAFKEALITQGKHDARGAEQFGALLAAAHLAEFDTDPTAEQLTTWSLRLKSNTLSETANKTDDWRECLNHLTDVIPEGMRNKGSTMPTLGHRLAAFRRSPGGVEDLTAILAMMGLAVSFPKGEIATWETGRLFIPASHPETRKQFAGTTWEGVPGATGVWHTTLQRCPDPRMIWPGASDKGLDKKRHGVFVQLAKAFDGLGDEDEGYEREAA